jgi:polyferredoxin
VYAGLIGAFVALGAWTVTQRSLLLVDVLRDRGSLAREAADGRIENAYTLKLANLAEEARDFDVEVSGLPGIELVGPQRFAGEPGIRAVQVTVAAPADSGPPAPGRSASTSAARTRPPGSPRKHLRLP